MDADTARPMLVVSEAHVEAGYYESQSRDIPWYIGVASPV